MKAPYEGQAARDKSNLQKKVSVTRFEHGDSSQSIHSVKLPEALEKILQAPSIIHAREPIKDPYLMNDVFLLVFVSMLACTGIIIAVSVAGVLVTQYCSMVLTADTAYLLTTVCLLVSCILVLSAACTTAQCTDCRLQAKQLARYTTAMKCVACTALLLVGSIALAVSSRLSVKFNTIIETTSFTQTTSVMGEPVQYKNKSLVKIYPTVVHKLFLNPSSQFFVRSREAVLKAMSLYNSSTELRHCWDSAQKHLSCCGAEAASDWMRYQHDVPQSCCADTASTGSCSYFPPGGCLIKLAYMQAWYSSMMAGAGVTALVVLVSLFFLLLYMYRLEKGKPTIASSTVTIKSSNNKALKWLTSPTPSLLDTRGICTEKL